jgi:purine-binding chemotaxis protein CheW
MSRPVDIPHRPKQALQSYLDGLLQEATESLLEAPAPDAVTPVPASAATPAPAAQSEPAALDEFEAAVLEEQVRDARPVTPLPVPVPAPTAEAVALEPAAAEPAPMAIQPGGPATPVEQGLPAWASEPFECLLFDVAGLTLAVPLVCLGSIYPLAGQELTPLFGQPEWFLGLLPSHNGNLKVLDTARWVMPDRYRDDFQQGLQYVISVQGYEWGLAVHSVSRSLRLDPVEIKWRAQRGQRPWLAGTVIEHMCALLDVTQLAEMIASGAVKRQEAEARAQATAKAKADAAAARGRKR